jgi:3-deoxy-manno-octulosonate cytidylyltransferase (CMP-KDO synthetase)
MNNNNYHIIIPARYQSSRFPGKPLADIFGKPMIIHVYERALQVTSVKSITVATDDERILNVIHNFGGNAILTSSEHLTGTDRLAEAAKLLGIESVKSNIIINLQGDEPFIRNYQIESLMKAFNDNDVQIASLCKKFYAESAINNPNMVKVVKDLNSFALYFSRSNIPYDRAQSAQCLFFKHLGVYAYTAESLQQISSLQPGELETIEQLEQLRWLENGYRIKMIETDYQSPAVDTPDDLKKIVEQGPQFAGL